MVARLEQDAKRRAEEKTAPVGEATPPRLTQEIIEGSSNGDLDPFEAKFKPDLSVMGFEQAAIEWLSRRAGVLEDLLRFLPAVEDAREAALWDEAVESLGRSARNLEELAESTGEAIARISARGDRIDRIQKDTRALLNALVVPQANA
jgi:hypothetical protein